MCTYYFNITYNCNSNCMFCAADIAKEKCPAEMTIDEIENVLKENNVTNTDRVILNGGEPTIHKNFIEILHMISKYNPKIILFTNGKRFNDAKFTQQVLHFNNIHIKIPLFSANAHLHDSITGKIGNFSSVVSGIDNICKYLGKTSSIEIKLLLSKITVPENELLYDMIMARWGNSNIHVSLNPLLLSTSVIENKELFMDLYTNMIAQSEKLIVKAKKNNPNFSVSLMPYCSFPNEKLLQLCREEVIREKMYYNDHDEKNIEEHLETKRYCKSCIYIDECNGYPEGYLSYYGKELIRPIFINGD